eukprot:scaffold3218_cov350-Prasinococcus_capsulatus_cf.AAC.9
MAGRGASRGYEDTHIRRSWPSAPGAAAPFPDDRVLRVPVTRRGATRCATCSQYRSRFVGRAPEPCRRRRQPRPTSSRRWSLRSASGGRGGDPAGGRRGEAKDWTACASLACRPVGTHARPPSERGQLGSHRVRRSGRRSRHTCLRSI